MRKQKLHLVFEFVDRTLLNELEASGDGLESAVVQRHLYQLVRSIAFCHARGVMHRDVKPENILITRNGVLKLCDFGFARTLDSPGGAYSDYIATRWYRAPELLLGDSFTQKGLGLSVYGKPVDVWAVGCMLPEMATGGALFQGETDIDQVAPWPALHRPAHRSLSAACSPSFAARRPPRARSLHTTPPKPPPTPPSTPPPTLPSYGRPTRPPPHPHRPGPAPS